MVKYISSNRGVLGSNLDTDVFFFNLSFIKNAKGLLLKMYLEYCSVFMRGTFCLLPFEPRVKLLNNGIVIGLRFGFRAVPTSDHRVAGSNPA